VRSIARGEGKGEGCAGEASLKLSLKQQQKSFKKIRLDAEGGISPYSVIRGMKEQKAEKRKRSASAAESAARGKKAVKKVLQVEKASTRAHRTAKLDWTQEEEVR